MTEINILFQDNKGQFIHLNGKVHGLTALKLVSALHNSVLPAPGTDGAPAQICGSTPRECGVKLEGPYTPMGEGQVPSKVVGEVRFES
jgi:hypothetical protein